MVAIDEADGLRFGADFEHVVGALEFQVLDHRHDVAISENCPVGVLHDALAISLICLSIQGPLMTASDALVVVSMGQDLVHFTHWADLFAHRLTGLAQGDGQLKR